MSDPRKRMTEISNEDSGALYMEICAALMTMMGKRDLTIPTSTYPMRGFTISKMVTPDGLRVRFRYDDEPFDP